MNRQLLELGQRALACKGWRFAPGMQLVADHSEPWRMTCEGHVACYTAPGMVLNTSPFGGWLPDFSDAATRGCLLALVRKAYDSDQIACHTDNYTTGWLVDYYGGNNTSPPIARGKTEIEALIAALEAKQ